MVKKKKRSKIAVIGAGSWGIALGNVLYENDYNITLWEYDSSEAKNLIKTRKFKSLRGYKIPDDIKITNSLDEAVIDAKYIVVSVPSATIKSVARQLSEVKIGKDVLVISTIKGLEKKTLKRASEVLQDEIGGEINIAVLSGPSHAEEVVKRVPTAVVCAGVNRAVNSKIQKVFSNVYFRVYSSSDIKGVEFGGAFKNVIAIASGISKGLGMGDNTVAALITRGNAEIRQLGVKLGAKEETFNGLSGIGDLIVTCFSEHSRNFRFGRYMGVGLTFEEAFNKIETTVEGISTAKSVYKLARINDIQMPVCDTVYRILFNGKSPAESWMELMKRPLKSEYFEN